MGGEQPDLGIELIDVSHCADSRVCFGNPRAVPQACVPCVTGFGVNLGESLTHKMRSFGSQECTRIAAIKLSPKWN